MVNTDEYQNPLVSRYCSKEMSRLFSPQFKFQTWRRLWIALARAQKQLGLSISGSQIEQMEAYCDDINWDVAREREKETRHDVMSHVYAFGCQCPQAKGIIHLGATSAYVGDNADLIQSKMALELLGKRVRAVLRCLSKFASRYANQPTLGFTHFQPAQLTTVGKRACLWLQDLLLDHQDLVFRLENLRFRGVKGTTGTQASFLELFDGDHDKVKELDRLVAAAMGFSPDTYVTGQTYPRKVDAQIAAVLSGIGQSSSKFAHDIRLLANLKEVEEPFESKQIGSSAMAYKRNPMRTERMCALSRFILTGSLSPAVTAATQWFERTLDDSANKRIAIPETFLAADAILLLYHNVADGLVVYPKMIQRRIRDELPFMLTENLLMEGVKRGGDRQELHEKIRQHSIETSRQVKLFGGENDLIFRIANDSAFGISRDDMEAMMDPTLYVGRAPEQVQEFLDGVLGPVLAKWEDELAHVPELQV